MSGFGGSVRLEGEKEYRNALTQITQNLKLVSAEMKASASAFDVGDKSSKQLKADSKELSSALEKEKSALATLKTQLAQMQSEYDKSKASHEKLVKEYDSEKAKLDQIGKTLGTSSEEYKKQEKVVDQLKQEVDKSQKSLDAQGKAMTDVKTKTANAETTINKTAESVEDLGNKTKKSGDKAKEGSDGYTIFKNVLANLATQAINTALDGLKKLTSAVIDIGKQAVEGYADFEQLKGGVEKLFGASGQTIEEYAESVGKSVDEVSEEYNNMMTAQSAVIDHANEAYRTAGLSANEYMETVTSFSASLIASLDGDTVAAAEYADKAISDMADNANTFGSDISSIQSAYQGFAKQNYTMLDNLKLGYGGTKTEMARLIEDADALSDSFTAQRDESGELTMAYSDIIEAIHIVQDNMNITGTTAREADKTISGSIASTKSAWQNLVNSLGDSDADISKLVNNVIQSASNVLNNISPIIKNIVEAIPEAIKDIAKAIKENDLLTTVLDTAMTIVEGLMDIIPDLIEQVMTVVIDTAPKIMSKLGEILPDLLETVINLVSDLLANLGAILEPILDALPDMISTVLLGLAEHIGEIVSGIVDVVVMILDHLPEIIKAIIECIPTVIIELIKAIKDNLPTLILAIIECVGEIALMLGEELLKIWDDYIEPWLSDVLSSIGEWFTDILSDIGTFFSNIWSSITSWFSNILNKIGTFFSTLISNVANFISKAVGNIASFFSNIVGKVAGFVSGVLSSIGSFFSNIWGSITNWFSKILSKVGELIRNIPAKLREGLSAITQVGTNLVQGLWNGISNAASWVLNKIRGFGQTILNGIKSIFGIHSPSTVFRDQIGKNLALGLGEGFTDEMRNVTAEMENSIPTNFDVETSFNGSGGIGQSIVINVYGAVGQDVSELADLVSLRLQRAIDRKAAVYA